MSEKAAKDVESGKRLWHIVDLDDNPPTILYASTVSYPDDWDYEGTLKHLPVNLAEQSRNREVAAFVVWPEDDAKADVNAKRVANVLSVAHDMLTMLKELEWVYSESGDDFCPACRGSIPGSASTNYGSGFVPSGHKSDCKLAVLLRRAGGEG